MNNNSRTIKRLNLLSLLPPILLAGFVIYMSVITYWHGDALYYKFIHGGVKPDNWLQQPVESFGDFWTSQWNHYLGQNGRFFCHVLVSFFCVTGYRVLFAICDALVWLAMIGCFGRLCGFRLWEMLSRPAVALWTTAGVAAIFTMQFDPPYQINYIWMSLMSIGWILLFFSNMKPSAGWLPLIFLFSLLAGQGHEANSLPVGIAVAVYFIIRRFMVSRMQWWLTAGYAIGAVTVGLAPGVFSRIGIAHTGSPLDASLLDFALAMIPLFILLATLVIRRRHIREAMKSGNGLGLFLAIIVGVSYIMYLCYWGCFGLRVVVIGMAACLAITMRLLKDDSRILFGLILTVVSLIAAYQVYSVYDSTKGNNMKFTETERLYRHSPTGDVVVPDSVYAFDSRLNILMLKDMTMRVRCDQPGKDTLYIAPASLAALPRDCDTNLVKKLAPNRYLLVQSATHPARFIIQKRVFGRIKTPVMPDRVIENLDTGLDIHIFTPRHELSAYYTMNIPESILKVDIQMEPMETDRK